MGLITEVQELKSEYKKARKEAEQATKKAEELQKKLDKKNEEKEEQKKYEKDLKKAVENDLITTFERCFERDGLEKGYINLRLKSTRDEILKNIPEGDQEWHYLNDNYEKILNKVKKIYENDKKAKEELMQNVLSKQLEQQKIKQEEKQKQEKKTNLYITLINIFFLLVNPITIILFLLILGYFKIALPILNS